MKSIGLLSFVFIIFCSCDSKKSEMANEPVADSIENMNAIVQAEDASPMDDEENINDEDHGDPGLAGLIVDSTQLAPAVKTFLSSLTLAHLDEIISDTNEVLIIAPGPGVHPIHTFAQSKNDLLQVKELYQYLSDSLIHPMTLYRMVWDPCEIREGKPEAVYLRDLEFQKLTFFDNDDTVNQKLQRFMADKQSETGVELFIKFRSAIQTGSFLHLMCIRKNGLLSVVIIDQQDCGA